MKLQFQSPPPHIHDWWHYWEAGEEHRWHPPGFLFKERADFSSPIAEEVTKYASYNHGGTWTYIGVCCADCGEKWT